MPLKKAVHLELNEAYTRMEYWFFDNPTKEVSLNELAATLNISKTTAHRVVTILEKEAFLKKQILGKLWRITCHQEHHYTLSRKIAYHFTLIREAGIVETIREQIPGVRAIILFGSYRKGDDTEESDIDIGVEVFDTKQLQIQSLGVVSQLGNRKNVPVNIHLFSRKHVDVNVFANIANGIILDGFLEVHP